MFIILIRIDRFSRSMEDLANDIRSGEFSIHRDYDHDDVVPVGFRCPIEVSSPQ